MHILPDPSITTCRGVSSIFYSIHSVRPHYNNLFFFKWGREHFSGESHNPPLYIFKRVKASHNTMEPSFMIFYPIYTPTWNPKCVRLYSGKAQKCTPSITVKRNRKGNSIFNRIRLNSDSVSIHKGCNIQNLSNVRCKVIEKSGRKHVFRKDIYSQLPMKEFIPSGRKIILRCFMHLIIAYTCCGIR